MESLVIIHVLAANKNIIFKRDHVFRAAQARKCKQQWRQGDATCEPQEYLSTKVGGAVIRKFGSSPFHNSVIFVVMGPL